MRTRAALVMSRDSSTWKPNGGDYSHSTFPLLFVSNTLPEGAATAILSLLKAGTRTHADWRFTVRARESASGSCLCARLGYGFRWLASVAELSSLATPHQVGRTVQYSTGRAARQQQQTRWRVTFIGAIQNVKFDPYVQSVYTTRQKPGHTRWMLCVSCHTHDYRVCTSHEETRNYVEKVFFFSFCLLSLKHI